MSFWKDGKVLAFAGGVLITTVVPAILKSKAAHNVAVSAMAKSMEVKDDTQARVTSVKEEAQDIYAEAKDKNK